jgi:general secretion pathway protein D
MLAGIVGLVLLAAVTSTASNVSAAERPKVAAAAPSSPGDLCRPLPAGKRLKLNLKPNTEVVDLVAWISAITCKHFIVPGSVPSQGKAVTIVSPRPITAAEAYHLFLAALDSVGLTVYPSGQVLRVIETSKVKSSPLPLYIDVDIDDQG